MLAGSCLHSRLFLYKFLPFEPCQLHRDGLSPLVSTPVVFADLIDSPNVGFTSNQSISQPV